MRVVTRSANTWTRLLIGAAAAAVVLSPGIRRADADGGGQCNAAKEAPKTAAALAPSDKAAPRAIVRVISMPLKEECPADDNEAMNAVKAFIDPATGELRAPTPEEQAALARAIAPKAARLALPEKEVMVLANGIVTYEIGEDAMQDVVVRTGADGKPVFLCTPRSETPGALTRSVAPKTSDPAKEEK